MTAARMLAQLRLAVFAIFLLAVTAMAWHDARPVLLLVIAVVALAPVIFQADQPDPGEGYLCETCGDMAVGMRDGGHYCERHMILPAFIDPQGGRHGG